MALSTMGLLQLLSGYPTPPLNVRQAIISPPPIPNRAFTPPGQRTPPPGQTPSIPMPPLPGQRGGQGGDRSDKGSAQTPTETPLSEWGPGEKPGYAELGDRPGTPTGSIVGGILGALAGLMAGNLVGGAILGSQLGSQVTGPSFGVTTTTPPGDWPAPTPPAEEATPAPSPLAPSYDLSMPLGPDTPAPDVGGWSGSPTDPTGGHTGPGDPGMGGSPEGSAGLGGAEPGAGYGGWGGGGDVGGGGQSDAGGGIGSGEGGGGAWARGGVQKARRPTGAMFGEAGPETGVFVPEWMKRPGIQGKERTIIAALETLLRELKAGSKQAKPTAARKES